MLLSIDIHDFLPIEKEVYCIVAGEEQPVKKKLVLVFDDFERCKIGVIDLLGIINTYVEDKRIKTIVIASEDNIEDEENYKTFKEKVVERTVKLDMEYRRIQQEMIEDYKTETSEYKEFLKKESPKLFQVFEESGSRNLRTFKSCLIDFERVYGLWHSLKLPTDGMGEALYVFAAYLFEVKGGNYKKMDYLKNPTYERGLAAKSKILVCFNDELLAAFLSAYKKANISEQQEMLTILKEISFRGGAVERDETDTEVTRKNLEKLENALNSEVEHTSDAVKKFYANRHLETVKQIRQKFLNTREM
ncbi:P-loop NTPase fold protein [Gemmiger formicilis]